MSDEIKGAVKETLVNGGLQDALAYELRNADPSKMNAAELEKFKFQLTLLNFPEITKKYSEQIRKREEELAAEGKKVRSAEEDFGEVSIVSDKERQRLEKLYGISKDHSPENNYVALDNLDQQGRLDQSVSALDQEVCKRVKITRTAQDADPNQPQDDQKDIELFLKQLKMQAMLKTASTYYAAQDRKDKRSIEEIYAENYQQLLKDTLGHLAQDNKDGTFSIPDEQLAAWQATATTHLQKAYALQQEYAGKGKDNSAFKAFGDKIKKFDTDLSARYGAPYTVSKNILKAAGYAVVYSSLGPAAPIAAVAKNVYNLYGRYKDDKKKNPNLTGKEFVSNHKMLVAGALLAAGGYAGIVGPSAKAVGAMGLGVAAAAGAAYHAYKTAPEGQKTKAALKSFGLSAVSLAGGYLAGRVGSSMLHQTEAPSLDQAPQNDAVNTDSPTGPVLLPEQEAQPTLIDSLETNRQELNAALGMDTDQSTQVPENGNTPSDHASEQADTMTENAIDPDNLTAEQQHDVKMLFLRDPHEANLILGHNDEQQMNSRELQEAWDKPVSEGGLTEDEKLKLVEFGGQRFDEHGHYQDVEGYPSAAQMESDAVAWTRAHQPVSQVDAEEPIAPDDNSTPNGEVKTVSKEHAEEPAAPAAQEEQPQEATSEVTGQTKFIYKQQSGNSVAVTLEADGTISSLQRCAEGSDKWQAYTQEQLDSINANPATKTMVENWQHDLAHQGEQGFQQKSSLDLSRVTETPVDTNTAGKASATETSVTLQGTSSENAASTVQNTEDKTTSTETTVTTKDYITVKGKQIPVVGEISADKLSALIAAKKGNGLS